MRRLFLLSFLCIAFCGAFSQRQISPMLSDALKGKKTDRLNIIVYFENQSSMLELADSLDLIRPSFGDRVKSVTRLLHQNHELSYSEFVQQIAELQKIDIKAVDEMQGYWIANAAKLSVKPEYVYAISKFNNIRYMDLDIPKYRIDDKVKEEQISEPKTVGGAEWGLKNINAPSLWAMNYTGRNVLMLSIDTGVNPEHPAINTNYAGNNYPVSQCWYGFKAERPRDKASSSHGTHTTGTAMGLDRLTSDTIGVAYNAKWIACDPVASKTSELLTVSEFFAVYEWVLNPDGDEETTNDVPRVINNSWGYDYQMAAEFGACELPEGEILIALETAGICSPFSAGNEGSGSSTIGFPAMLAYNLVNPFSIGALSSQNAIASFSSRGPSTCVEEATSLQIKPEVSAPGLNVRSCIGLDDYGVLSGTSMACPHVSGALLLLAEAFPNASARELKEALYNTAIDLGDEGEDNVFGRGIIDVLQAYNYLATFYTPKPPVSNDYDLSVDMDYSLESGSLSTVTCINDRVTASVKVINSGINDIENINLKVYLNGNLICDTTFLNSLTGSEMFEIQLANIQSQNGENELRAIATTNPAYEEYDVFNNSKVLYYTKYYAAEYPYSNNFENGKNLTENSIAFENPDNKKSWEIMEWGDQQYQALAYSFNKNSTAQDVDNAFLPEITLPDNDSVFLSLTYAYKRHYSDYQKDSMKIELSTDCGVSYPYLLWENGGPTMYTETGSSAGFYIPEVPENFDTITISLSEFKNRNVIIRFSTLNGKNSELYIDDIRIGNQPINNVNQNFATNETTMFVYPNPSEGVVNIEFSKSIDNGSILIYDMFGSLLSTKNINGTNAIFDMSELQNGVYIIKLKDSNLQKKLILLKK